MAYDRFEQLVHDAQFPVTILGNPQAHDFELIDLTAPLPEEASCNRMRARGLFFIGAVGLVDGVPCAALGSPLNPACLATIAEAYVRHAEAALNRRLEVSWLKHLHELPDQRA
jgi:hypothetical protein